jgi:hypothetical protein
MLFSFKPISLEDRELITGYTFLSKLQNCDFAFSNMCSWRFLYDSEFAVSDRFLFIRFYFEEKGHRHLAYMFPIGDGDLQQAIERIAKDAETIGHALIILGVTPVSKKIIDQLFPEKFTFIPERDYFDYIYLREDLIALKGKKYQPKRNHINRFKNLHDYSYIPLSQGIISECMMLEQVWYEANKSNNNGRDLSHEKRSMYYAMEHFNELNIQGGAIVVDGKIIAFTYGSPINQNTFGVHVEKADVRYEGIFSVICQEFVQQIPQQFVYINREEDLGIPGLRQSKLSYHPTLLLEKNAAIKRR